MDRLFKIVTLGCKVNQYESAALAEALEASGLERAPEGEKAGVVVLNTCLVTQRAAHQCRQALRKAVRENPGALVAAAGCYAQVSPQELARIRGVRLVVGNRDKPRLAELLLGAGAADSQRVLSAPFEPGCSFVEEPVRRFAGRARAYLKIQDGCEALCSYCVVPRARGPYRSLPPLRVLPALEGLAAEGCCEVVLTGIHLGRYGVDLGKGMSLGRLLTLIGKEQLGLRVRLSSLEPNEVDESLIEQVASEDWLCRHFHVPLQSGDDGILTRMNRHYPAGDFSRLVEAIRRRVPQAAVGVDVMAGFPGEDERAFENTRSLLRGLPVSYLHVFPFSPRPGTPAAGMRPQNDPGTIRRRAAILRRLGLDKKAAFHESCLGRSFEVLREGWEDEGQGLARGTTDNYLGVIFPCGPSEQRALLRVRLKSRSGSALFGERL